MRNQITKLFSRIMILGTLLLFFTSTIFSQSPNMPVVISMHSASLTIVPGEKSVLIIEMKVPRGYWIGSEDLSTRLPAPTIVEMDSDPYITFEKARFPKTVARGVPVHKGNTYVYDGKVTIIVPFSTNKNLPAGEHSVTARLTYTPGLNAGHLNTHIKEPYSATFNVNPNGKTLSLNKIPSPSLGKVPNDFLVYEDKRVLPEPLNSLFFRISEESSVAKALHWVWVDPENHGKHIQTVWMPFLGDTENNGKTAGMGVALVNVTKEGIMTGLVQLRGYWNEHTGTTFALEAVSCPAAYFNYWLSAQISTNGEDKQFHFHNENLTLGQDDRFGYELQTDDFHEPRSRFYGIGQSTRDIDISLYTRKEYGGTLDFYWLPADHFRIGLGGKYLQVDVADAAEKLRGQHPFTTDLNGPGGKFANVPGIRGGTVAGARFNIVYDSRNSEFLPTSGFYGKITAEYNNVTKQVITTANPVNNYGKFYVDLRKYFSTTDQMFTLLFRNTWTLTTDENIPFFDQATLGGDFSDRAFDAGRFIGQNSFFASMEFRISLMHMGIPGFPMDIEMAPFIDVGQVFNGKWFTGRFNVNPGVSIRFLNRPNVGIVGNAAWGQDGIVLTGGVQLPF